MILLNDERVLKVKCYENYETFSSLRNVSEKIVVDETKSQIGNSSELFCYARLSVIQRLIKVAESLPYGYQLVIKECYRPLSLQVQFFQDAYDNYRLQNPGLTEDSIYELTCQFVAPVNVAGHITGGAVDLTLIKDGKEIEMGSAFNEAPIAPENLTYTDSPYISREAQKNRSILVSRLQEAGFVNYPSEWWHWSYGDRYWGLTMNREAIYGPTDENIILNSFKGEFKDFKDIRRHKEIGNDD